MDKTKALVTLEVGSDPRDLQHPLELRIYSDVGDKVFKKDIKHNLYHNEIDNLYDILVTFDNKEYRLHSLVLIQSPTLSEILPLEDCVKEMDKHEKAGVSHFDRKNLVPSYDITEDLRSRIFQHMNTDHFEKVLKYLYFGSLQIPSDEEVIDYYLIFKGLKLKEAVSSIRSYMSTFINPLDAALILDLAYKRGHMEVYRMCLKIIGVHAGVIFSTDAILNLGFQHLIDFIIGDIEIDEDDLFLGVKKWIDHYAEKSVPESATVDEAQIIRTNFMLEHWKKIEQYIRWPQMSSQFLHEKVEPLGFISQHLLDEAYQHIALVDTNVAAYIPRGLRLKARGRVRWVWSSDPSKCNSSISVTCNGTVIRKTTFSSHASVLGTKGFRHGKYVWKLKLNSQSHWVGVGVCFPSQLTRDLTNDYSCMYGASSQNQYYQMNGNLATWVQNEIITCTLIIHGNVAKFNIKTSGGTDIHCTIPMGNEELVPIANLYSQGNELILLK